MRPSLATIPIGRFISPKTADHHIQHIYNTIGASTRAAAALWAMEQGVVGSSTRAGVHYEGPGLAVRSIRGT